MIKGINHINLSVSDIERSFSFYTNILGFKPLCKSQGSAYFLASNPDEPGSLWVSLDLDRHHVRKPSPCNTHIAFTVDENQFDESSQRILNSNAKIFKGNTSPGQSLYFLNPDGHKLEIHTGNWQDRIKAKKENLGQWKNVEWFVSI